MSNNRIATLLADDVCAARRNLPIRRSRNRHDVLIRCQNCDVEWRAAGGATLRFEACPHCGGVLTVPPFGDEFPAVRPIRRDCTDGSASQSVASGRSWGGSSASVGVIALIL